MSQNPQPYRVMQLGPPNRRLVQYNIEVSDFNSLVTHHPKANRDAALVDGVMTGVEKPGKRIHAFIGGEFQEIEMLRTDEYRSLKPDQVLLIKDFILEHPKHSIHSAAARMVDVPAPVAGYIGRIDERQGLVDIYDKKDGDVIARVRHMRDISNAISIGQSVEYGQALGTQSDVKTGKKHVHLEMDTRYYQQFDNYIADLVSGRLPVQAEYRKDVQPLPVIDDGVMRLGESGERVAAVQRALVADGYRGVGDKPIEVDGVYRSSMQGAILAFQQDHRLPQTGDIDPATYQLALRVNLDKQLGPIEKPIGLETAFLSHNDFFQQLHNIERGLDPAYTVQPDHVRFCYPHDPARTGRAPQYHDHPDHMVMMPALQPGRAPVAAQEPESRFFLRSPDDDYVDAYLNAMDRGDYTARRYLTEQYEELPHVQALQQEAREALLAEQQRLLEEQIRQEQERQRLIQQMQQEREHSRSRGFSR